MIQAIYLPANDNVVVGTISADQNSTVGNGAAVLGTPINDLPEPSQEIKDYITSNSNKSFNLWVVDGDSVRVRTIAELSVSSLVEWDFSVEEI